MADLAISAVRTTTTTVTDRITVSEAVAIGDVLRLDTVTQQWEKAVSDTEAEAAGERIALTAADGGGKPIEAASDGEIEVTPAATEGIIYTISIVDGEIGPSADRGAGEWIKVFGTGNAAGNIDMNSQTGAVSEL